MQKYYEINARGCNVRCKLYYQDKAQARRAVIFCTGFAGHKDNQAAAGFAEKLLSKSKDILVVVFNWPAHGDDVKKKLDLADCDLYLDLVIADARSRFGVQTLYAYAVSFGGYLVLKYISEHENPFEKLALRCPAVDMYDVLTRTTMQHDEYDKLLRGKEVSVGFDRKIAVTRTLLEELKANDITRRDFLDHAERMLILHGTADEVVPFESSRDFADRNCIEWIPMEKANHRFQNPSHMSLANKYVIQFLDA